MVPFSLWYGGMIFLLVATDMTTLCWHMPIIPFWLWFPVGVILALNPGGREMKQEKKEKE